MKEDEFSWRQYLAALFLHVPDDVKGYEIAGRAILWLFLAIWGVQFAYHGMDSDYIMKSFFHIVNLVFHEAGHIIFIVLGDFMRVLGGSLNQVLMPLIAMLTLLLKTRDTFGAAVTLWWVGQNFIDLAPYINDARDLSLPLLGGITGNDSPSFHDWHNLLMRSGLIRYDHVFGFGALYFGEFLMLVGIAWGAYLLWRQVEVVRAS